MTSEGTESKTRHQSLVTPPSESCPHRFHHPRHPSDLAQALPLLGSWHILWPATSQNRVVKFDGGVCGGVLVENASDDFPTKRSSKISFQTSPEVRHQFRRKLRQLHSGNHWCWQIWTSVRLPLSRTPRVVMLWDYVLVLLKAQLTWTLS